jgi:DNA-binding transcriptional LysR family regulator
VRSAGTSDAGRAFRLPLFHRSGRNLQLTESARMLLPGIREGFAALERACNTLRAEDDILRMKAPSTLTMRWLLARSVASAICNRATRCN